MKSTALFLILLCVFFLISSCGSDSNTSTGTDTSNTKTFSVSGLVLESSSGLFGVSVRLTGNGKDFTEATSSTGRYTFADIPNGAYTVTPTKTDYTFNPPNATVTVNGANATIPDFTATKTVTTFTITGLVLESGSGLSGVSVHLTGNGKDLAESTSSIGGYAFADIPNGTYTIIPTKTDYTFNPPNTTATVNGANATVPDIAATKSTMALK